MRHLVVVGLLLAGAVLVHLGGLLVSSSAPAEELVLDDGRRITGRLALVDRLAENPLKPSANPDGIRRIQVIDDGLRRLFLSKRRIAALNQPQQAGEIKIKVPQRVQKEGPRVGAVGNPIRITPFDQFGRRVFEMKAAVAGGKLPVIQGITEVTPRWTKVEALADNPRKIVWPMYIATSNIPGETLSRILHWAVGKNNPQGRIDIVLLYIQAERFDEAKKELQLAIQEFPGLKKNTKVLLALRQQTANRLMAEVGVRQLAGQHGLAYAMLDKFPTDDVAGEVLIMVRKMKKEYDTAAEHRATIKRYLREDFKALDGDSDERRVAAILGEIDGEMNHNNYSRLTTYRLAARGPAAKDAPPPPDARQRLALAISGWVVGGDNADKNLGTALSLVAARNLIREYLRTDRLDRLADIREKLRGEEAGNSPQNVARILAHMRPPLDMGEAVSAAEPGLYKSLIRTAGENPDIECLVQLPPEYDPRRRYPAIVTLHGAATTPARQIDWWAGGRLNNGGPRFGQATRHGYIVIAPQWGKVGQVRYEADAREHTAVLNSLRDACRRYAIDTDRVYLTGHSMGGDAAWEIGVSHPDLWAGVIPINASTSGMVVYYSKNAKLLPTYFLGGELDGTRLLDNSRDLDRYLQWGYDATVVEYLGRGHEDFQDDVLNLFDWMGRKRRNFYPTEFAVTARRSWDNYFWWLELDDMPLERTTSLPVEGTLRRFEDNVRGDVVDKLVIKAKADSVTIWLTPQVVNFQHRVEIALNGQPVPAASPSVDVMLEDVRTRGDRLHPFWAKVRWQKGRPPVVGRAGPLRGAQARRALQRPNIPNRPRVIGRLPVAGP